MSNTQTDAKQLNAKQLNAKQQNATQKTWIQILREPRVFDMAMFDWIASLLGAYLVGKYVLHISGIYWFLWIFFWISLGVFVHYAMGINTMFGYYLGLNPKPEK